MHVNCCDDQNLTYQIYLVYTTYISASKWYFFSISSCVLEQCWLRVTYRWNLSIYSVLRRHTQKRSACFCYLSKFSPSLDLHRYVFLYTTLQPQPYTHRPGHVVGRYQSSTLVDTMQTYVHTCNSVSICSFCRFSRFKLLNLTQIQYVWGLVGTFQFNENSLLKQLDQPSLSYTITKEKYNLFEYTHYEK